MVIVLAIFGFLFYRIMSAAMFDDPMTIWACIICALISTGIAAYAGVVGLLWAGDEKPTGEFKLNGFKFLCVTVAACLIASIAAYLIVLGFSQRLFDDISRWSYRDEFYETDWFWFVVMISIPLVVHLALFYKNLKGQE